MFPTTARGGGALSERPRNRIDNLDVSQRAEEPVERRADGPSAQDGLREFPAATTDPVAVEAPGAELYALLPGLGREIAEEPVPEELQRLAMALAKPGGTA